MYPRVIRIPQFDLLPPWTCYPFIGDTFEQKDLTGGLTARFWMKEYETGQVYINGASAVIAQANPGILVYSWVGNDTAVLGHFLSWAKVYFGPNDTIPLTVIGPEVFIVEDGFAAIP